MKSIIEKQILEWEQEVIKQNAYVLRLQGGIQALQMILKKTNEQEEQIAEEKKAKEKEQVKK